jgi:hypothetical protein
MTPLLDHDTLKRLSADAISDPAAMDATEPSEHSRLGCRWHKDGSGRLTCTWRRLPAGLKSSTSFKGAIDMNTAQLHAQGGEASALSTTTAPRGEASADCAAGNCAVGQTPNGSRVIQANELGLVRAGLWIAGFAALLAVNLLFLALLSVNLLPFTATHVQAARPVSITFGQAGEASKQPTAVRIAPAEVIDPNPVVFIGTGDGSAGSWTRL